MVFVGIDPGVSGGMAAVTESGAIAVRTPKSEESVLEWLANIYEGVSIDRRFASIEQVTGYTASRGKESREKYKHGGQPGSRMFRFGQSYGNLRMALVACGLLEGITWRAVPPRVWTKGLEIPPRTVVESKADWKRRLREEARYRFPSLKVTLKTCDALLLAVYCQQVFGKRQDT